MLIDINEVEVNGGFIPAPQLREDFAMSAHGVVINNELTVVDMAIREHKYTVPSEAAGAFAWYLIDVDTAIALTSTQLIIYELIDGEMRQNTTIAFRDVKLVYAKNTDLTMADNRSATMIVNQKVFDDFWAVKMFEVANKQLLSHNFLLVTFRNFNIYEVMHFIDDSVVETENGVTFNGKELAAICGMRFLNDISMYVDDKHDSLYAIPEGCDVAHAFMQAHIENTRTCRVSKNVWLQATPNGMMVYTDDTKKLPVNGSTLLSPRFCSTQVSNAMRWVTAGAVNKDNDCNAWRVDEKSVLPVYWELADSEPIINNVYACENIDNDLYALVSLVPLRREFSASIIAVDVNGMAHDVTKVRVFNEDQANSVQAYINTQKRTCALIVCDNLSCFMRDDEYVNDVVDDLHMVVEDGVCNVYDKEDHLKGSYSDVNVVKSGEHFGKCWRMQVIDFANDVIISSIELPVSMAMPTLAVTGDGQPFALKITDDGMLTSMSVYGGIAASTKTLSSKDAQITWTSAYDAHSVLVGTSTGQVFIVADTLEVTELEGDLIENAYTTMDELFTVIDDKLYPVDVNNNEIHVCRDLSYSGFSGNLLAVRRGTNGLCALTKLCGVVFVVKLLFDKEEL